MKRPFLALVVSTAIVSNAAAQGRVSAPLVPHNLVPRATADSAWLCPANPGDECMDSTGLRWFSVEENRTAPESWMAGFETVQTERRPVGVCRVPFGPEGTDATALLIGVTGYNMCVVGVGDRSVTARNYEVLIGGDEGTPEQDPLPRARWVAARAAAIPRLALRAGNLDGQPLAICRVRVGRNHRLGYVGARTRGCVAAANGRATTTTSFESLARGSGVRR